MFPTPTGKSHRELSTGRGGLSGPQKIKYQVNPEIDLMIMKSCLCHASQSFQQYTTYGIDFALFCIMTT